jgi:hypothetical protein
MSVPAACTSPPHGISTIGVIRDAVAELDCQWEAQLGSERWQELKRLLALLNQAIADEPAA